MLRFLRYASVGAAATATHYAVLVAGVRWFGWPAAIGSGVGAVVGAQVAYLGNRGFTFDHRGAADRAWPKFQATALLGGLLGMAVVGLGVHFGMHYLAAQGVATALGLVVTFSVNRAWTFAPAASPSAPAASPGAPAGPLSAPGARSTPPATLPAPPS